MRPAHYKWAQKRDRVVGRFARGRHLQDPDYARNPGPPSDVIESIGGLSYRGLCMPRRRASPFPRGFLAKKDCNAETLERLLIDERLNVQARDIPLVD